MHWSRLVISVVSILVERKAIRHLCELCAPQQQHRSRAGSSYSERNRSQHPNPNPNLIPHADVLSPHSWLVQGQHWEVGPLVPLMPGEAERCCSALPKPAAGDLAHPTGSPNPTDNHVKQSLFHFTADGNRRPGHRTLQITSLWDSSGDYERNESLICKNIVLSSLAKYTFANLATKKKQPSQTHMGG